MDLNAKTCPKCHGHNIYTSHMYGAGDKNECRHCGHLWGWYYDRNNPENKMKPSPN